VNTAEIVAELAEKLNLPKNKTRMLLDSALETLADDLAKGRTLAIPGLGTFGTKKRDKIKSYNPQTKRLSLLPPKIKVFFRPGKILKNDVKDKGNG